MAKQKRPEDLRLSYDPFPGGRESWYREVEIVTQLTERHRSEVRHCLSLRVALGREAVERYLVMVAKRRGKEAADKLMADTREQWALNNRGVGNDWREPVKEAA